MGKFIELTYYPGNTKVVVNTDHIRYFTTSSPDGYLSDGHAIIKFHSGDSMEVNESALYIAQFLMDMRLIQ